jgi:hypothetical protein
MNLTVRLLAGRGLQPNTKNLNLEYLQTMVTMRLSNFYKETIKLKGL